MAKRKLKKARLSVYEVSLARVIQEAVKEFIENHRDGRLLLFERPPPKG
jgi:hypothetical protein